MSDVTRFQTCDLDYDYKWRKDGICRHARYLHIIELKDDAGAAVTKVSKRLKTLGDDHSQEEGISRAVDPVVFCTWLVLPRNTRSGRASTDP